MAPLSRFYAVMGAPAATRHRTLRGHVGPSGSDALMDFTKGAFTRDSVATFHTGLPTHSPGELLTRYGIDVRRMRPGGGIFMEGARTNYVLDTEDLNYTLNSVQTLADTTGPDGSSLVSSLLTADGGLLVRMGANVGGSVIPQSTTIALSSFAKRIGAITDALTLTGRSYSGAGISPSPIYALSDDGVWERQSGTMDSGVTGATFVRVHQNITSLSALKFGITGMQIEEGAFASSLIETFGAAGTRGAEGLLIPVADVDPRLFTGPFEIKFRMVHSSDAVLAGAQNEFLVLEAGTAQWLGYKRGGDGIQFYAQSASTETIFTPGQAGIPPGTLVTMKIDPANQILQVTTDSGLDITVTSGTIKAWAPGDVSVGNRFAGLGFPAWATIYPPTEVRYSTLFDFSQGVFVRDSSATFHTGLATHKEGELLTRYDVDEPRWRGEGLYMEGSRTNHALWSTDWSQVSAVAVSKYGVGPDGAPNSVPYYAAVNLGGSVLQLVDTIAENAAVAFSGLGKHPIDNAWRVGYRTWDGATAFGIAGPIQPAKYWNRAVILVADSKAGTVTPYTRNYPSVSPPLDFPADIGWYGWQVEEGTFASSIIETTDAVATRSGEGFTIPADAVTPVFYKQRWEIKIIPGFSSDEMKAAGSIFQYVVRAGATAYVYFHPDGSLRAVLVGGNATVQNLVYAAGDEIRIQLHPTKGLLRVITPTQDITEGGLATSWPVGEQNIGSRPLTHDFGFHGVIYAPSVPSEEKPMFTFLDGIFTRDSVATFHHGLLTASATEKLVRFAVDEARLRAHGGLFLEQSRTNLIPNSTDTTKLHPYPTRTVVGPDGLPASAYEIDMEAVSNAFYWSIGGAAFDDNVSVSHTYFGKTPVVGSQVRQQHRDNASVNSTAVTVGTGIPPNVWQRGGVSRDDYAAGGNTWFHRALAPSPFLERAWYGFFGGQTEQGAWPTSLIETTGVVGTRSPEVMIIPESKVSNALFENAFSIRLLLQPSVLNVNTDNVDQYILWLSSASHLLLTYDAGASSCVLESGGQSIKSPNNTWDHGDELLIRVNPKAGELSVENVRTGIVTTAPPVPNAGWLPADVRVGSLGPSGGSEFSGVIYPPTWIEEDI